MVEMWSKLFRRLKSNFPWKLLYIEFIHFLFRSTEVSCQCSLCKIGYTDLCIASTVDRKLKDKIIEASVENLSVPAIVYIMLE